MGRTLALLVPGVLTLLVALSAPAAAQNAILERRYPFANLDKFWTTTLAADPDPAWFAALAAEGGDFVPVVEASADAGDFDVPFVGVIVGEDSSAGGAEPALTGFPVIAIPVEHAPTIYRRLALLELYLGRYGYFVRTSTDTAEGLALLEQRQRSAGVELYLIYMMLYFSEDTLEKKCARLRRLDEVAAATLAGVSEASLTAASRPLFATYKSAQAKFETDKLRAMVCAVDPVRSRGEMLQRITDRVRVRIATEVEAKVRDTLTLLGQASEDLQTLVNEMNVTIRSAEILELERVLSNVQANMLMVKNDQLKAGTLITELQNVDLSQLSQPTELADYSRAVESMGKMVDAIDRVLEALAKIEAIPASGETEAALDTCNALRGIYRTIDLNQDTASVEATIVGPYEQCLAKAEAVVLGFKKPSLEKKLMAEFSTQLRALSEAFLRSGS